MMNSPAAKSRDVRPSCGILGEAESHAPVKYRDEVVDSSLVRDVWGEVTFKGASVTISSLAETKRRGADLRKN